MYESYYKEKLLESLQAYFKAVRRAKAGKYDESEARLKDFRNQLDQVNLSDEKVNTIAYVLHHNAFSAERYDYASFILENVNAELTEKIQPSFTRLVKENTASYTQIFIKLVSGRYYQLALFLLSAGLTIDNTIPVNDTSITLEELLNRRCSSMRETSEQIAATQDFIKKMHTVMQKNQLTIDAEAEQGSSSEALSEMHKLSERYKGDPEKIAQDLKDEHAHYVHLWYVKKYGPEEEKKQQLRLDRILQAAQQTNEGCAALAIFLHTYIFQRSGGVYASKLLSANNQITEETQLNFMKLLKENKEIYTQVFCRLVELNSLYPACFLLKMGLKVNLAMKVLDSPMSMQYLIHLRYDNTHSMSEQYRLEVEYFHRMINIYKSTGQVIFEEHDESVATNSEKNNPPATIVSEEVLVENQFDELLKAMSSQQSEAHIVAIKNKIEEQNNSLISFATVANKAHAFSSAHSIEYYKFIIKLWSSTENGKKEAEEFFLNHINRKKVDRKYPQQVILNLILAGIDVNAKDSNKNSALHLFLLNRINSNDSLRRAIVTEMLKAGADILALNSEQCTPLSIAEHCYNIYPEFLEVFIEHHAKSDAYKDIFSDMLARVVTNHELYNLDDNKLFQLLMMAGVSEKYGSEFLKKSLLHRAIPLLASNKLTVKQALTLVNILLECNPDLAAVNEHGESVVVAAILAKVPYPVIEAMKLCYITSQSDNAQYGRALLLIVQHYEPKFHDDALSLMKSLIRSNAPINYYDKTFGNYGLVHMLVEKWEHHNKATLDYILYLYPDLTHKNYNGETPADFASFKNHSELSRALQNALDKSYTSKKAQADFVRFIGESKLDRANSILSTDMKVNPAKLYIGWSVFHWAVSNNNVDIIKKIKAKQPDIRCDYLDEDKKIALLHAVTAKKYDCALALVPNEISEEMRPHYNEILELAVENGAWPVVDSLLKAGLSPFDATFAESESPYFTAIHKAINRQPLGQNEVDIVFSWLNCLTKFFKERDPELNSTWSLKKKIFKLQQAVLDSLFTIKKTAPIFNFLSGVLPFKLSSLIDVIKLSDKKAAMRRMKEVLNDFAPYALEPMLIGYLEHIEGGGELLAQYFTDCLDKGTSISIIYLINSSINLGLPAPGQTNSLLHNLLLAIIKKPSWYSEIKAELCDALKVYFAKGHSELWLLPNAEGVVPLEHIADPELVKMALEFMPPTPLNPTAWRAYARMLYNAAIQKDVALIKILHAAGAPPTYIDDNGNNFLHVALGEKQFETFLSVQEIIDLLALYPDIFHRNNNRLTAKDIVLRHRKNRINSNNVFHPGTSSSIWRTSFAEQARRENNESLNRLNTIINVLNEAEKTYFSNITRPEGGNVWHAALQTYNFSLLNQLVQAGDAMPDRQQKDAIGRRPIRIAIANKLWGYAMLLLPDSLNEKEKRAYSEILRAAVAAGKFNIAERLLQLGVITDWRLNEDDPGIPLLPIAINSLDIPMIELLLNYVEPEAVKHAIAEANNMALDVDTRLAEPELDPAQIAEVTSKLEQLNTIIDVLQAKEAEINNEADKSQEPEPDQEQGWFERWKAKKKILLNDEAVKVKIEESNASLFSTQPINVKQRPIQTSSAVAFHNDF